MPGKRVLLWMFVLTLLRSGHAAEPAYTVPRRPALPRVKQTNWCRTPVDRFILAALELQGLRPSAEADKRTLLRRVTFDLIGLPPTPTEVNQFLSDNSPLAYERLVDRLLASPQYGVRWGQHWLDVVRYADSDGFEYDDPRPHAWRYRDWVIESFNSDKPFRRFVSEQIAADELYPNDRQSLAALGLNRLGPLRLNAGMQDLAKNRQEVLTEITDVIGAAFLGLTLGCARCHDHKFDPLTQADYYRIQSFFAATSALDIPLLSARKQKPLKTRRAAWMKQLKQVQDNIDALVEPVRKKLLANKRRRLPKLVRQVADADQAHRTRAQSALLDKFAAHFVVTRDELTRELGKRDRPLREYKRLHQLLAALQRSEPRPVPSIMGVADQRRVIPDTFVLFQGNPRKPRAKVAPRFPQAFEAVLTSRIGPKPVRHLKHKSSGRRAALANWLASSKHPLTTRVFVNRIWQHHFGRGIVASPNDFGEMGSAPTHPKLLDWLATELAAQGGQVKAVHRVILLSSAYRQQSKPRAKAARLDPNNDYFWKMNRRRLESEALRDGILAVSGELNLQAGGPGVRLPLSKELAKLQYKGVWQPHPLRSQHARRTVFVFLKRNNRPALLESFDSPSTMQSCGRRSVSVHAGQALTLLNGEFSDRQARAFARRLIGRHGKNVEKLIQAAYSLALNRRPKNSELQLGRRFLDAQQGLVGGKSNRLEESLGDFCLVIFNLDEFLFVD